MCIYEHPTVCSTSPKIKRNATILENHPPIPATGAARSPTPRSQLLQAEPGFLSGPLRPRDETAAYQTHTVLHTVYCAPPALSRLSGHGHVLLH